MAKLIVLGTCAGTGPMPGRQHRSFVIEAGGRVYWFDAGEGCSRTAHLMGVDLLTVRAIFISHPHMDHVGGLRESAVEHLQARRHAQGKCRGRQNRSVHVGTAQLGMAFADAPVHGGQF